VRRGSVYRSEDLGRLGGEDAIAFARLGIRTVYDLRTADERAARPDRLPAGTATVVLDVLYDSTDATPAQLMTLFEDPRRAAEALGVGGGAAMFERKYREFVALESARMAYRRLFAALADGACAPALFHCTTGKDRTGWAAAVLLLFLGVPYDAVMADYLLSADRLAGTFRPTLDAFAARGGDPDLLLPLVGVRPSYLETALDEMRRAYGTVEAYVANGLGIDTGARQNLRARLVQPA
jgi:protein-tyrosine phosphatase